MAHNKVEKGLGISLDLFVAGNCAYMFSSLQELRIRLSPQYNQGIDRARNTYYRRFHPQCLFIPAKFKQVYLMYILANKIDKEIIIFTIIRFNAIRVCQLLRRLSYKAVIVNG
jgi:hypothetical protein